MGKFPFFAEFDKRASFLQIPIKNGKVPIKMGKFPFIAEHVAFDKRTSFLQIPIKMGKFL